MPPLGGPPRVFLGSNTPYEEFTDETLVLKRLAESSAGIEHFLHIYNYDGWRYSVTSGDNFRVTHPRADGKLWMIAILYRQDGT